MENRAEFATDALNSLAMWMKNDSVRAAIQNERVRLVYGVAFATMISAGALLGTITVQQKDEYQAFLLKHGAQGLQDVIEETFLAQFWRDIITYRSISKIDAKLIKLNYVTMDDEGKLRNARCDAPGAIHVCYIGYAAVFTQYAAYKRTLGKDVPLSEGDVRRELEREPYFIPNPKAKNCHAHQRKMRGKTTSCWVLSLERQAGDEPEEMRPFLCPFAQDLIDVMTIDQDEDEA